MRILVAIDDTDNLQSKTGTGKRAAQLIDFLEQRGWGRAEPITRHQLLVDPAIPYTSHNSAMCFAFDLTPGRLPDLIELAGDFLAAHCDPGSDPGLCVTEIEKLAAPGRLIAFGYRAKEQVLSKAEAYALAEELAIHLSEHGGTGDGVVGSLAGAGLRLSGCDGRLRGKLPFSGRDEVASAGELRRQTGIELVKSLDGQHIIADDAPIRLGETLKGVMLLGQRVLLVYPTENPHDQVQWQTCTKNQLRAY
jgi:hypothetical protein